MKHLPLLSLAVLTIHAAASCGLFVGASPVEFASAAHPEARLLRAEVPDSLQTEDFLRRLNSAARESHGSLLPFESIHSETDYRYDRFEQPLNPDSADVLRVGVPDSSIPLLVFVRNTAGEIVAVGGMPAAAETAAAVRTADTAPENTAADTAPQPGRRGIIALALPPDSTLEGVGFISPQADDWDSESAPQLELGSNPAELIMTTELFQLPAGLRVEIDESEVRIGNLTALQEESDQTHASSRAYIELAYRNTLELPEHSSIPLPETITAELKLPDGSIQTRAVRLRQGRTSLYFHPGNLGSLPDSIRLSELPDAFSLQRAAAAVLSASDASLEPLPIDLGSLYSYDQAAWRNDSFELFQWSLFPHVLYFDFADYTTQARFFRRLAFFVEKDGYQGSLLDNRDLQRRHGYNAHNYNAAGLAGFFTAADNEGFELNQEEELLRRIAVEAGIITGTTGDYRAGTGGVLSISRESPFGSGLRNLLMSHEAMHGVFYEETEFSEFVWQLWEQQLTPRQREFWRLFMRSIRYSPDDEYLMVNELQAYLLQYSHRNNDWYFNSLIRERMLSRYPDEREFINRFYRENPDFFMHLSQQLNQALYRSTGLIGGDVRDIVAEQIE